MPPIYVECEKCGHGHLWIPTEVQRQLDRQQSRIAELEAEIGR